MSYHPPGPDRSPISRIFVILRTRQDLLSLGDLRLAATAYAGTEQVSPGNCAVGGVPPCVMMLGALPPVSAA